MAHSAKESWVTFLRDAGIPDQEANTYAGYLFDNRITDHFDLSKDILKDLGITIIGDIIAILKFSQVANQKEPQHAATATAPAVPASHSTRPKTPAISAPQLKSEMTHPEFRKFKIDWSVFKTITKLPADQIPPQLYNCCDSDVQNSIINTTDDFLTSMKLTF